MLNKLHYCYGIDTNDLFTAEESKIEKSLFRAKKLKARIKNEMPRYEKNAEMSKFYAERIKIINSYISDRKNKLKKIIAKNSGFVRELMPEKLTDRKKISIFDSALTRCFGLSENETNTEIMVIRVYYFGVAESIIKNGFIYNGQKYVFFSSSAGQIRTKKMVCVREDLLKKHWNTLTCGLSVEKINSQGGMNINKYLAYLALCSSATDEWTDFDIDRVIVVDDFETEVSCEVDFIDDKTYDIERKEMPIAIPHTDGCGMILPELSKKNFMVRMPFVKGLLGVFDFKKFIKVNGCSPIVTDIYGKKHDLIAEDIKIILTKSQFKMHKFYSDWEEYKTNFKKYSCHAGICSVEEEKFTKAKINYQMIQSLIDITDSELKRLCGASSKLIDDISSDSVAMLKAFGAFESNPNKNAFQKCLMKYPELLGDVYCRQSLRDIKKSLEKELWSAKFEVNGYYTFILPDLYAFCEHLFFGIEKPLGLLKNGEVHCGLFGYGKKLDCLRSPHLYQEHAIRENVNSAEMNEWFITSALYTSTHDPISRILQFDVDGDKSLVIEDGLMIEIAERNMRGIVPLYYEMKEAATKKITPENLYEGLALAFTGGNIGVYSNAISIIKNSPEIAEQGNSGETMRCIKWLCMQNNYVIDYAKTLYKPEPPEEISGIIKKYTNRKLPYFFRYAKDKEEKSVDSLNDSPVNRLRKLFPPRNLNYKFTGNNIGRFDYKMLMYDSETKSNPEIVKKFIELTKSIKQNVTGYDKDGNYSALLNEIKNEMLKTFGNEKYICDSLVKRLFDETKSLNKRAFWSIYGSIVYENICGNLADNLVICLRCKKRFYTEKENECFCESCQKFYDRLKSRNQKIIICSDCGKEVKTDISNRTTKRCGKCQREYVRLYDRNRKRDTNSVFLNF